MEGEVCKYDKFGYCKYKDDCQKKHFSEECGDLSECKNIKSCDKSHPKKCKINDSGNCSYKNLCAYNHQKTVIDKYQAEINEKVKKMEIVVQALTRKVLSLEEELKEVKKKDTSIKIDKEPGESLEINIDSKKENYSKFKGLEDVSLKKKTE